MRFEKVWSSLKSEMSPLMWFLHLLTSLTSLGMDPRMEWNVIGKESIVHHNDFCSDTLTLDSFSGAGMPLQVFIKLFFSLFGLSKLVGVETSPALIFSFQLPRTEHDLEQPGGADVSLPDSLCPLHVGHHHRLDQPLDCHDVRHLPKDTGLKSIIPGEPHV